MKKGDARRSELLATAERLFYTKGYEGTSVQDIIDEMGFSKGGFYHHFDSKLAVLEAICAQRAEESCTAAREIVRAQTGGAVDKLNALLYGVALFKNGNENFVALLIHVAYCENGALMREKMKRCQLESLNEVMEAILREGQQSREFFIADVPAMAQLILRLYMQFTDEVTALLTDDCSEEQLVGALVSKLNVYRCAIERVLLAPFGSIVLFDAKELQLLAQDILRRRVRERADALLSGESLRP